MKKILLFVVFSAFCQSSFAGLKWVLFTGFGNGVPLTASMTAGVAFSVNESAHYDSNNYIVPGNIYSSLFDVSCSGSVVADGQSYSTTNGYTVDFVYVSGNAYAEIKKADLVPDSEIIVNVSGVYSDQLYDVVLDVGSDHFLRAVATDSENYGAAPAGSVSVSITAYVFNEYGMSEPFEWSGFWDFSNGALEISRSAAYPIGFDPYVPPFDILNAEDVNGDGSLYKIYEDGVWNYYSILSSINKPDAVSSSNSVSPAAISYDDNSDFSGRVTLILNHRDSVGMPIVQFQRRFDWNSSWYSSSAFGVFNGEDYFFFEMEQDAYYEAFLSGVTDYSDYIVYSSWWLDDVRNYRFTCNGYPIYMTSGGDNYTIMPVPGDEDLEDGDYFVIPVEPDEDGNPNDIFEPIPDNPDGDSIDLTPPDFDSPNPDYPDSPSDPGIDPDLPPSDPDSGGMTDFYLCEIAQNTWGTKESVLQDSEYSQAQLFEDLKQSGYLNTISTYEQYNNALLGSIYGVLSTDSGTGSDSLTFQAIEQNTADTKQGIIDFSGTMATHQAVEYDQWALENQKLDDLVSNSASEVIAVQAAQAILDDMNQRHSVDSVRDTDYQVAMQAWAAVTLGHYDTLEQALLDQGVSLTDTARNTEDILSAIEDLNNSVTGELLTAVNLQTSEISDQTMEVEAGNRILSNLYAAALNHSDQFNDMNSSLSNIASKSWSNTNVVNVDMGDMADDIAAIKDALLEDVPIDIPGYVETNDYGLVEIDVEGTRETFDRIEGRWTTFLQGVPRPTFPTGLGTVNGLTISMLGGSVSIDWDYPEFGIVRNLIKWMVGILTFIGGLRIIRSGVA